MKRIAKSVDMQRSHRSHCDSKNVRKRCDEVIVSGMKKAVATCRGANMQGVGIRSDVLPHTCALLRHEYESIEHLLRIDDDGIVNSCLHAVIPFPGDQGGVAFRLLLERRDARL